jgi:RHS repeat-associated protein
VIEWPGGQENADGQLVNRAVLNTWWGNLISEKLDASGMKYMRNRYYSPETGQFTQQDPIGLAGGMNLYGFAAGDPVNFSDPMGLCPDKKDPKCSAPGGVTILALSGAAAIGTLGANIQAGVAFNNTTGDAMFFFQGGPTFGAGAMAGVGPSFSAGSLNDVFTPSDAPHGPISVAGGIGPASGSVTLSGGPGSRISAVAVGLPKPALGFGGFFNFSWGGKGTSTFNLPKVYETAKAAAQPPPSGISFTCAKAGTNCGP